MFDPKSDILGLFAFFRSNKSTKIAFFNVFLDGRAKKSNQNGPQKNAPSSMILGICGLVA